MRDTSKNLHQIPCVRGIHQEGDEYLSPMENLRTVLNMRTSAGGFLRRRCGYIGYSGATNSLVWAFKFAGNTVYHPDCLTTVDGVPVVGSSDGWHYAMDASQQPVGTTTDVNLWGIGRHSTCRPIKVQTFANGLYQGINLTGLAVAPAPGAVAINDDGFVLTACIISDGTTYNARVTVRSPDGSEFSSCGTVGAGATDITKVQAVAVGDTFWVIYQSGTLIRAASVAITGDSNGPQIGSVTTVATLTSSSAHWDTACARGVYWYLVYQNAAAQCTVARMSDTTVDGSATFAVTGTVPLSIACSRATMTGSRPARVWVGYYDIPTVTGNVGFIQFTGSLGLTVNKTTIVSAANIYGPALIGPRYDATGQEISTGFLLLYRSVESTNGLARTTYVSEYIVGTGETPLDPVHGCLPVSKPGLYNRFVVATNHSNATTAQYAVIQAGQAFPGKHKIELSTPRFPYAGASYSPSSSSMWFHSMGTKPADNTVTAERHKSTLFAAEEVLNTVSSIPILAQKVYEFTTGELEPHVETCVLSRSTLFAGSPVEQHGIPETYPNQASSGSTEVGFLGSPVIAASSTAAGNVPVGAYLYRAVYRWVDVYGRKHQSAPSPPFAVVVTGTPKTVTITVASLPMTMRYSGFNTGTRIELFRTINGDSSSYRKLPYEYEASAATTVTTYRNFADNFTDAQIAGNESLYTDGGVVENVLAPSSTWIAYSEDRVWFAGGWDPSIVYCSKLIVPEEQVGVPDHPAFQVTLNEAVNGIVHMDGAIIAFSKNSILLISGDGPDDRGQGSFTTRYLVQGNGCINGRSILKTPIGVIFQSASGFQLIPRGFGPLEPIGLPVRDDTSRLTDRPKYMISAAVVTQPMIYNNTYKATYACYLMGDTSGAGLTPGSATEIMVYDTDQREWFRDSVESTGAIGAWPLGLVTCNYSLNSGDASASRPLRYMCLNSAINDTNSLSGTAVRGQIATGWIHPFGIGGFGHVRKVMLVGVGSTLVSGGDLAITLVVYQDGATTGAQTASWTIESETVNGKSPWYREMDLAVTTMSTIKVYVQDDSAAGNATFGLIGFVLEVEDSGGVRLIPLEHKA